MIYYSTGKGTYKRGEVGVAVETDEATAKILIEKGYLKEFSTPIKKVIEEQPKVEQVATKVEIIQVEEPRVKKVRGNPAWGKKKS